MKVTLSAVLAAFFLVHLQQDVNAANSIVAIAGYCPVTAKEAQKLVKSDTQVWGEKIFGEIYLFSGEGEREKFKAAPEKYVIALSGNCPVAIRRERKMRLGHPRHSLTFDGRNYWFESADAKAAFQRAPALYAPVLSGDCITCWIKSQAGIRVRGTIAHYVYEGNRLYLFTSEEEKKEFKDNVKIYKNRDVVDFGRCPVASASGRSVVGSWEFTEVVNGHVYLFESEKSRSVFNNNRGQFLR